MHENQILPIVLSRIGKMKLRIDLGQIKIGTQRNQRRLQVEAQRN